MTAIQVNERIKFDNQITNKNDLKRLASKYNLIDNWKTLQDVSVNSLADILKQGYTVRPGIKTSGNKIDDVESLDWLFLDFDNSTVESTLKVMWSKKASLWYHSPSYIKGENEKHRLVFKLSRTVTPQEYEHVYKVLIKNFYKGCDPLFSPGYLFFGAYSSDEVHIINPDGNLPVDTFLKVDLGETEFVTGGEENEDTPVTNDKKSEGVRGQVLRWIASEIWNPICKLNIDELYALHPHKFESQGKDKNNLEKWGGHRPEDTEKDYGTGFFVYWNDSSLPPRWKNQGNGLEGNFLEYWQHYGNELYNKRFDSIYWEDDRDYKNLQVVADDIANYFKVKYFDFNKARRELNKKRKQQQQQKQNDLITDVEECINKYVHRINDSAKVGYMLWNAREGKWKFTTIENSILTDVVKPYLKEKGYTAHELYEPKITKTINNVIHTYDGYNSSDTRIIFDNLRKLNIIPMANGDYNTVTGEFTQSYSMDNYNTTRSPIFWRELTGEEKGVKVLNQWLKDMEYTPEEKAAIKAWIILNATGNAHKSKMMLCIFGTPQTGKTVIGNLIQAVLTDELSFTARGNQILNSSNRFGFQSLEGKQHIFIDEFRPNYDAWEVLKTMTGNSGINLSIEKKFGAEFQIKFRAGITTATQDQLNIPVVDDGGIERRVLVIRHGKHQHKPHLVNIDREFERPEVVSDIFNWAVQQDIDKALEDLHNYRTSDLHKQIYSEVLRENDAVLTFMHENMVFTDDENDQVTNDELQLRFSHWLETEQHEDVLDSKVKNRIKKISQFIRQKAEIKNNGFKWEMCPPKGKKSRVKDRQGKWVLGFKGVRFKSEKERQEFLGQDT